MKRWFNACVTTGDLWEWDSETDIGQWVNPHSGKCTTPSGLGITDFAGSYEEVFPMWGVPSELRTPEGL